MEHVNPFVVMTTIAKPSTTSAKIIEKSKLQGKQVVVVGDRKTPKEWETVRGITYLPAKSGELLDSYARKNLGYLYAMKQGATHIFDLDDDNEPVDIWGEIDFSTKVCRFSNSTAEWLNIYKVFGISEIWPRGLPLHAIHYSDQFQYLPVPKNVAVWQSLCNGNPDTDAIYRLINNTTHKEFYFGNAYPVVLNQGTICPFNAQNTLFNKEAFPLLYLPHTVTMRFSDILRSIVAQPILWAAGYLVGFTGATVYHRRHPHDLMKDFYDEIPCYTHIEKVYKIVKDTIHSNKSIEENLVSCYVELYNNKITTTSELGQLLDWIVELKKE